MIRMMATVALAAAAGAAQAEQWVTEGFESFRRGTFGNAGQNLYVSKAGVLQRIHIFDLDRNGYVDLPFANCQNHHESAPSYVYALDGKRLATLPGQGSLSGTVADLDGDGHPDLVVAGSFDAVMPFASTDVYFGSSDGGYSSRRHIRLQTPRAQACCAGRFDGGRPALAFALTDFGIVRIYEQTDHGFEWRKFLDIEVKADRIAAADLDGDGFDDLCTRLSDSTEVTVFWGGAKGVDAAGKSTLPAQLPDATLSPDDEILALPPFERAHWVAPLLDCVDWAGRKAFALSTGKRLMLFSATKERTFERLLDLDMPLAKSVATGDLNGDGRLDLAIACQSANPADRQNEFSYVLLGAEKGFGDPIALNTRMACSVAISGGSVLFAQSAADLRYTNDALLFSFENGRLNPVPRRFQGEDMQRAFFVDDPGRETRLFLLNNYSRSAVGSDKAYVYWGEKDGYDPKRRTEVPAWCGVDTLPADLDDDGWAELLVCNNAEEALSMDPGLLIHRFGPKGFDPGRSQALPVDVGWGAIVADFDRDGYLDIISSFDFWYGLRYFHGGPDGFSRHEDIPVQLDPYFGVKLDPKSERGRRLARRPKNVRHADSGHVRWPIAVDVNMDGWLDLVVPIIYEDRSYVLWGGPDGFSRENRLELAAYHCVAARAVDLDKNGYPEIILGGHTKQPDGKDVYRSPHHSYVHIYWNGPEGLSESNKMVLRADAADSMAFADFDGNGWLDMFVGSYQGEVDRELNSYIYWNRGGKFEEFDRQELVTHVVSGCIAADFNEDGYVDLATANHKVYGDHVGVSYVWWNGKHGFCQQNVTKLPTAGPHGMCTYEPGDQMDRSPEEHYVSEVRAVAADAVVTSAKVEGEVPAKSWTKLMLRANGGEWREAVGFRVKKGDAVQYRLSLGSVNSVSTPRITKVTVEFKE